jgi:trehalose/maltose hydrolase-like predicted phosphorylase
MMIIGMTSLDPVDSVIDESKWMNLLRSHIQEWKQHYNQVNQAIQDQDDEHQRIRSEAHYLSDEEKLAVIASQDQEVDALIDYYQAQRELIRKRQQQELEDI